MPDTETPISTMEMTEPERLLLIEALDALWDNYDDVDPTEDRQRWERAEDKKLVINATMIKLGHEFDDATR